MERDPLTPMQQFFLKRLEKQVRIDRRSQVMTGALNEQQRFLLKRAIFSTYRDLVDLDLIADARRILGVPTSTARP